VVAQVLELVNKQDWNSRDWEAASTVRRGRRMELMRQAIAQNLRYINNRRRTLDLQIAARICFGLSRPHGVY
jgi:lipopolysaccharide/colanic/teichoic acid biosynthesis glycosyltransferase